MKGLLGLLVVLGLAAGGLGLWYYAGTNGPSTTFRTVAVERGSLVASISATGTIQPEEVVDVGAQVTGRILHFGRDLQDSTRTIDYGSRVEEGTILAQIDDAIFRTQVEQAKANVQRAEADVRQLRARFAQAERDWKRVRDLGPRRVISDLEFDTIQATYETARSTLAQGDSAVAQARAALQQAEINLGYTTIRSPVRGVIIDRRVNVGQTVVSNLSASSMFLIAKDLKRMQVWAAVNEADVGQIRERWRAPRLEGTMLGLLRSWPPAGAPASLALAGLFQEPRRSFSHLEKPGQVVRFSVDMHPGEVFEGEVTQIRLNASMTQNVVTYTVVVETENSSLRLKPYATANLQMIVSEHHDVWMVPNVALRWRPQLHHVSPASRDAHARSLRRRTGPALGEKPSAGADREKQAQATVWVEENGFVRPIKVQTGVSDGTMTEVSGPALEEGLHVVVGEVRSSTEATVNPFTPAYGARKRD